MQVAVVQHDIAWQDAGTTRKLLEPLITQAAGSGARLIVLTEMFATGFSMQPELVAEPAGGPTEAWLIAQARAHNAWIVGSIAQHSDARHSDAQHSDARHSDARHSEARHSDAQHSDDGRAVNVAVLAAPDGCTHRYEKMHPFSYAGEHEHYRAGHAPLTVDVEGLRVSIFVCYDLRFADDFWALADDTDCYVVVANWPSARREHWQTLLRARAIENQAYVVGANRVGRAVEVDHTGNSAIIDPLGRVLSEGAHVQTVLCAEVEPTQVREVRARYPFLADRRSVGAVRNRV